MKTQISNVRLGGCCTNTGVGYSIFDDADCYAILKNRVKRVNRF